MQGAAVTLLLLALVGAASAIAPVTNATGGWRQGRATFYGGSQQYLQNFPDRYCSRLPLSVVGAYLTALAFCSADSLSE